jgi:hypothetical protein
MEERERARVELERQRREAGAQGDLQRLAASTSLDINATTATGLGRGRGRGISNLPSWMVEQLKKEVPATASAEQAEVVSGQFADALANNSDQRDSQQTKPMHHTASLAGHKRKNLSRPSTVLLLQNMISAREVDASLTGETQSECEKYGHVLSCQVCVVSNRRFPRCPESERVRIFVQFERQDAAVKALK